MADNGVENITDKFLNEGSLFGLKFRQGYTFIEVTGWEQVKYEPFVGVGSIGPKASSGFSRLNDPSGDDVLHVGKGNKQVIHAAIGCEPAFIRRYTNYPEGQNRLRTMPNLGTPVSGDNYGYVDGTDSPYSDPTDAEELMVPPGTHLDFNFYNPDSREREPVLSIMTRVYDIRVLDPSDSDDASSIARIVAAGSPMPIYPVGSTRNQKRYKLNDEWGVQTISREQAKGGN